MKLPHIRWGLQSASNALIFVHGHTSSKETWKPILNSFGQFDCIAVDLRGHGEATLPEDNDYTPKACATDLHETLSELVRPDQKLFLVGHSMGSRVVVPYSVEFPSQVCGVVIEDMDFTARADSSLKSFPEDQLKAFNQRFDSLDECKTQLKLYFPEGHVERWAVTDRIKQNDDHVWSCVHPYSALLSWAQLLKASGFEYFRKLARSSIPTIAIFSDVSTSAASDYGIDKMKSVMRRLQTERVEGSAHSIHRTHTAEFETLVQEFINKTQ